MITFANKLLKSLGHKPDDWGVADIAPTMTHLTKCLRCQTQFGILETDKHFNVSHVQMATVYSFGPDNKDAKVTQRAVITTIWNSYLSDKLAPNVKTKADSFFICERLKILV